ncbi:MAG: phosphate ABC transporter permease subunit PstC [Deltaproteobacteria bacterium]|nr:phosphate ABC transporter permease subunit PstC [Deltaproteobacteria bacterium]
MRNATAHAGSGPVPWLVRGGWFSVATGGAAILIPLVMVALVIGLALASWPAMKAFGPGFLASSHWNPATDRFGAAASLYGTLASSAIAMFLTVPLAFFIAVFLTEFAPSWLRAPVRYAIETLASIPSIIYGMWGLFVLAPMLADPVQPWLRDHFGFIPLFSGPPIGIGMMTAGIILALMILPYMTSILRDVLYLVPPDLRESAYGMGSTSWEVTWRIHRRYAASGIFGAFVLGLGRAIGETMAVTFVIGNNQGIHADLFSPATTIAATLANEFTEASEDLYLSSLFELGLILLLVDMLVVLAGQWWLRSIEKRRVGA